MEYLEAFRESGALLEGHFLLSSGLHSPKYLQCAQVLQYPELAEKLCVDFGRQLSHFEVETIIGPAIGGIVVAYELARAMGVRGIFAERNKEGRMDLRRGFVLRPGERVLVCEDVVTTGRSSKEVIDLIRPMGATVVAVASLVDRTNGKDPQFGVPFEALLKVEIPTYSPEECPLCKEGVPLVKPGSRTGK